MYVNISLIFLQIFLNFKQLKLANKIIENLDKYIHKNHKAPSSEKQINTTNTNNIILDSITNYLNSEQVINKYTNNNNNNTSTDEILCVLSLFKSYEFLLDNKIDESKKHLKEYKRIFLVSKHKDHLPVFNTLKNFYHYLKIKIDYTTNSFKFYKHLDSLLNSHTSTKNIETQIYYLNSLGIANLKQKKYSQFFFSCCMSIIKQMQNYALNVYKSYLIYNIGLCNFYEKKYEKAYKIFKSVSKKLNHYPFLSYRIGICCLEIEMSSLKANSNGMNETVSKIFGYNEPPLLNGQEGNDNEDNFVNDKRQNNSNMKRIILNNITPSGVINNKINNERLIEAIYEFNQSLILLQDNIYYKKEINEIFFFY